MGIYTKPGLLITIIAAIMTMSFKTKSIEMSSPVPTCKVSSIANTSYSDALTLVVTNAIFDKESLTETFTHHKNIKFKNTELKFRKKFKRLPQVLPSLKPPVKSVEWIL